MNTSIIVGIVIAIFIIFICIIVYFYKKQKIESGFATSFFVAGLTLIADSFGTFSDKVFALLNGGKVSNNIIQLIVGFILIGIGLIMYRYIKNKLSIINLIGFKERRIEEHKKDLGLNPFEFKEYEIDLKNCVVKGMDTERYQEIIELIDLKMDSFHAENKEINKGYTGTAPIPLTMYAGHRYKGAPITNFFEYNRFEGKYIKLTKSHKWYPSSKKYPQLVLQQNLNEMNLSSSDEVVLGISITMNILDNHIQQFNAPFVHLSLPAPKSNIIIFEDQLKEYVETVFDTITKLSTQYCVKKIHLVISSQSCLAFELGRHLTTETYMCEVINYHFVNPNYKWGISFNSQGTNYIEC